MEEALYLYRRNFRPSQWLDRPYAMIGVPVVAAETDVDARRLATTPLQRVLALIRGEPIYLVPPVESMNGLWSDREQAIVEDKLGALIVGGPKEVSRQLAGLLGRTEADEVIITSDLYHHADRLRSYEILAEVLKANGK
jgi:hypothetical protein